MSDFRDPRQDEPQDRDQGESGGQDRHERPTAPGEVQSPHDALGAYSLGALDPDERRMFELHLFICAACRSELAAHERVAGLLPYGLSPQQPPAGARDRLLARARSDSSESPTVAIPIPGPILAATEAPTAEHPALVRDEPETVVAATPVVVEAAPVQSESGPATVPLRPVSIRRGVRIKLASLGWAAALLFVIASGLFFGTWSTTGPHASFEVEMLSRLPGGQILSLKGTGVPSASARLYVVENGRRAELTIDALPPLPPGRIYQLWFAEPNQPTRTGGAFSVDPRGDASVRVTIPAPLERVRAIAVTQEPAPGLTTPTGVHLLDWTP